VNWFTFVRIPKAQQSECLSSFFLSPFIAFVLAKVFQLESHFAVAVIIVGSMPGGAMSNLFCLLFGYDLTLSVAMTTISSLCSVFMLPLNIFIYIASSNIVDESEGTSGDFEIDFLGIGISACVVVLGTITGIFINYKTESEKLKRFIEWFGFQCGLGILAISMWRNAQSDIPIWKAPVEVFGAVILLPVILAVFALSLGTLARLQKPAIVAIAIESSVQNTNIALPITALAIVNPDLEDSAIGVPLLYAAISASVAITYSLLFWKINWSTVPSNESICTAFMTRYKFIGQATRLTCLFPCCWGPDEKSITSPINKEDEGEDLTTEDGELSP